MLGFNNSAFEVPILFISRNVQKAAGNNLAGYFGSIFNLMHRYCILHFFARQRHPFSAVCSICA